MAPATNTLKSRRSHPGPIRTTPQTQWHNYTRKTWKKTTDVESRARKRPTSAARDPEVDLSSITAGANMAVKG